jgi:hypothetical protein
MELVDTTISGAIVRLQLVDSVDRDAASTIMVIGASVVDVDVLLKPMALDRVTQAPAAAAPAAARAPACRRPRQRRDCPASISASL